MSATVVAEKPAQNTNIPNVHDLIRRSGFTVDAD